MPQVTQLSPRVMDLRQALEEFLLMKQADGAARRTLDYRYHVEGFFKAKSSFANV